MSARLTAEELAAIRRMYPDVYRDKLLAELAEVERERGAAEGELRAWQKAQEGTPCCFNCGAPCYNPEHGKDDRAAGFEEAREACAAKLGRMALENWGRVGTWRLAADVIRQLKPAGGLPPSEMVALVVECVDTDENGAPLEPQPAGGETKP